MKTYSEKLRDPRWQKKRLEIMQRDDFKCQRCRSATDTLNVHHTYYEKGKEPWEYDGRLLTTFCQGCHTTIENLKRVASEMLVDRVGNEILFHILTLWGISDPKALSRAVTSISPSKGHERITEEANSTPSTYDAWSEILASLGQKSAFTKGYLCMGRLVSIDSNCITIGFREEEADCIDLVNNPKTNHAILAAAFASPTKEHKVKYVVIQSNE